MGKQVTIGRDNSCSIRISNDPAGRVSRHHAVLYVDEQQIILEDHSTNGTWVNRRFIHHSKVEIRQEDEILLGNSIQLSWHEINRYLPKQKRSATPWSAIMICAVIVLILFGVIIAKNVGGDNFDSTSADNSECRIYTSGSFNWSGNCKGGYANGIGTITWDSGKKYTGDVSKGRITGKGREYLNDCLIYHGDFLDGKKDGYGTLYDLQSGEISRQGPFADDWFLDENTAQKRCREMAKKIVNSYIFLGGLNIRSTLHSFIVDPQRTQYEMTFDLEFNGNIETNNFYKCRVIVSFFGESTFEFVEGYSNDNVKKALQRTNYIDITAALLPIVYNFFDFFRE